MALGQCILVLSAALAAAPAKPPVSLPVDLTSKSGSIDMKTQTGTAKGDVVIRREDIVVCCDEADIKYSKSEVETVTCKGRVSVVRKDGTRASADLAVLQTVKNRVTLTGKPKIWGEETNLSGRRIIYHIDEDRIEVSGSRSRFEFKPKKSPSLFRPCPPSPQGPT